MGLRRTGGVSFDQVADAVRDRPGWSRDEGLKGRERWRGPCPLPGKSSSASLLGECRLSRGREELPEDVQEVLMGCTVCSRGVSPDWDGKPITPLGKDLFGKHLEALGLPFDWRDW